MGRGSHISAGLVWIFRLTVATIHCEMPWPRRGWLTPILNGQNFATVIGFLVSSNGLVANSNCALSCRNEELLTEVCIRTCRHKRQTV